MAGKYDTFYETATLIRYYYKQLIVLDPTFREKYASARTLAKKHCYFGDEKSLKQNEVKNTKGLRNALLKHIEKPSQFAGENNLSATSLYRILNGKRETIRIQTLKQIVSVFELEESFEHHKVINYVLNLLKEERLFEENWKKIADFSIDRLQKMVLKGVMILPAELYRSVYTNELKTIAAIDSDEADLFNLLKKETSAFYKFIRLDEERIRFFNHCVDFECDKREKIFPFYQAHLDLIDKLFEEMGAEGPDFLAELYASATSTREVELLSIYFRQYVRYSTTPWHFDVEDILNERFSDPDYMKIVRFCRKINISELFGYLCTWVFEGEDRKKLVDLLTGEVG